MESLIKHNTAQFPQISEVGEKSTMKLEPITEHEDVLNVQIPTVKPHCLGDGRTLKRKSCPSALNTQKLLDTTDSPPKKSNMTDFELELGVLLPKPNLYTPEESKMYLRSKLNCPVSGNDAEMLSSKLGYLPLALKLAVAHIQSKGNNYEINNFLEDFNTQDIRKTLSQLSWHSSKILGFTISLVDAYHFPLENIKNQPFGNLSMRLLNTMTFLPETLVPVNLLQNLPNCNKNDFEKALKLLQENHLISTDDKDQPCVSANSLLLNILQLNVSTEKEIIYDLLKSFKSCMISTKVATNVSDCYPRFESVKYSDCLEKIWKYVEGDTFKEFSELPLSLMNTNYFELRLLSVEYFNKYVHKLESVLGFQNKHILELYNVHLTHLHSKGKNSKALDIIKYLLPKMNKSLLFNKHVISINKIHAKILNITNCSGEAFFILSGLYSLEQKLHDLKDSAKRETLQEMFKSCIFLARSGSLEEQYNQWLAYVKDRNVNETTDHRETLKLLLASSDLIDLGITETMDKGILELFDDLYENVMMHAEVGSKNSSLALDILFGKAKTLYCWSYCTESINVYQKILTINEIHQSDTSQAIYEFLKPAIKIFDKEPIHYRMCEGILQTIVNNPNADHSKTISALDLIVRLIDGHALSSERVLVFHNNLIETLTVSKGMSHSLTLKAMLAKAYLLMTNHFEQFDSAWQVYLDVCKAKDFAPATKPLHGNSMWSLFKQLEFQCNN